MTGQEEKKKRRAPGEHGVYWEAARARYVAQATVGYDGRGKRIVKKGTGKSRTAALDALRERIKEHEKGLIVGSDRYTVRQAVEDWLTYGQGDVDEDTVKKHRSLAEQVYKHLGARKLKQLRVKEVEVWLDTLSAGYSTRSLGEIRAVLNRSVVRAMKHGMVAQNVVELTAIPRGRAGRTSHSLTLDQARDVLMLTNGHPMHAYIVISLVAGLRTEEVRALRWDHVDLDGDPGSMPPVPPSVAVWRSVRKTGDTKTPKSRRTLALSAMAVQVLRKHKARQMTVRHRAGNQWQDTGLVFTTSVGTMLDAANVRRGFRNALKEVPSVQAAEWTPRDLRHSFVSIMSEHGIPLEEISRLVGHSGTGVTERVYRHELRPVIQAGAEAMDAVFGDVEVASDWRMMPLFSVEEARGAHSA